MECKYCGAVCRDGSVFCSKCGKRIDDKTFCDKCGALCEASDVFCSACGTRLDGKKNCAKCGAILDGEFCAACGTHETAKKRSGAPELWKKIVALTGLSSCALAVLFGLIFVFFIGVHLPLGDGLGSAIEIEDTSIGIFDYFYDAYQNMFVSGVEYSFLYRAALIVPCVIMTLISAASLVLSITFSLLAVVRLVAVLRGTAGKKRFFTSAVLAVLSYVGCAVLFTAFHVMEYSLLGITYGLEMNTATKAGMILSLIFLGIGAVCEIVLHTKELLKVKTVIRLSFALGLSVIAIISLVLCADGALSVLVNYENVGALRSSYMGMILETGASLGMTKTEIASCRTEAYAFLATQIVSGVIGILLVLAIVFFLARSISALEHSNKRYTISRVVFSAISLALSIANLIVMRLTAADFYSLVATTEGTQSVVTDSTVHIALLVLMAIVFVVSVADAIFANSNGSNSEKKPKSLAFQTITDNIL